MGRRVLEPGRGAPGPRGRGGDGARSVGQPLACRRPRADGATDRLARVLRPRDSGRRRSVVRAQRTHRARLVAPERLRRRGARPMTRVGMFARVALLVAIWLLAWGEVSIANLVTGIVLAAFLLVAFPVARSVGRSQSRL